MFYSAPPYAFERARELRMNMTQAEEILWEHLKKKQLNGYKFRRQHPVFKFIVDFYCHKAKLVVELDGEYHNRMTKRSRIRKSRLIQYSGIKPFNFLLYSTLCILRSGTNVFSKK